MRRTELCCLIMMMFLSWGTYADEQTVTCPDEDPVVEEEPVEEINFEDPTASDFTQMLLRYEDPTQGGRIQLMEGIGEAFRATILSTLVLHHEKAIPHFVSLVEGEDESLRDLSAQMLGRLAESAENTKAEISREQRRASQYVKERLFGPQERQTELLMDKLNWSAGQFLKILKDEEAVQHQSRGAILALEYMIKSPPSVTYLRAPTQLSVRHNALRITKHRREIRGAIDHQVLKTFVREPVDTGDSFIRGHSALVVAHLTSHVTKNQDERDRVRGILERHVQDETDSEARAMIEEAIRVLLPDPNRFRW